MINSRTIILQSRVILNVYFMCKALESNFEEDTPLFVKFINMVINDATVQLDESLSVS